MFHLKYLVVSMTIVLCFCRTNCDYYTPVHGMKVFLEAECHLLNLMKDLLTTNYSAYEEHLERLNHIRDEYVEAMNDPRTYLSNPISVFKLLKRFVVDWALIEKAALCDVDFTTYFSTTLGNDFQPPTDRDLKGAALGLARLQKTYDLSTTDLAEGRIMGTQSGLPMSVSDCMELGMILYRAGQYENSLSWLLETKEKLMKIFIPPTDLMAELLRYLSAVHLKLGDAEMSPFYTKEILRINPKYKINFEDLLPRKVFDKTEKPNMGELSAMTCRGERRQTPSEQRPLRCMYTGNGVPYRLIGPFKMEQLNLDPLILVYHQAITDREREYAIKQGEPKLERSTVVGEIGTDAVVSEYRTSRTGWLYDKSLGSSSFLDRLDDMTGLNLNRGDLFQVVNYGIGGHYGAHWDFSTQPEKAYTWRGNRIATALFYLNDVDMGGATGFPFLKLAVAPEKGSLVLWNNLHESLEPDFRTLHAGCPVLKGSKWS